MIVTVTLLVTAVALTGCSKPAASGKPVVWFFVTNEFDKDAGIPVATAIGPADLAFTHESVLKRRDQFLWVRGDQTIANRMKIRGAPMVRITDPEGDTLLDAPINGPEPLLVALIGVMKEKYVNKPVQWGGVVRSGPIRTSFLVVAFDADGGEALKLWEDRSLVKYHKMCDFVRLEAGKGGDLAKKWGVAEFPSYVICDALLAGAASSSAAPARRASPNCASRSPRPGRSSKEESSPGY